MINDNLPWWMHIQHDDISVMFAECYDGNGVKYNHPKNRPAEHAVLDEFTIRWFEGTSGAFIHTSPLFELKSGCGHERFIIQMRGLDDKRSVIPLPKYMGTNSNGTFVFIFSSKLAPLGYRTRQIKDTSTWRTFCTWKVEEAMVDQPSVMVFCRDRVTLLKWKVPRAGPTQMQFSPARLYESNEATLYFDRQMGGENGYVQMKNGQLTLKDGIRQASPHEKKLLEFLRSCSGFDLYGEKFFTNPQDELIFLTEFPLGGQ